jgi:hypothetical protein
MSEVAEKAKVKAGLVNGQTFNFLPIPIIEHNSEWFEAGPVTFAVETRVLGAAKAGRAAGGGTIHVFSADRAQEFVRFDCFDAAPHYHYINQVECLNTVWAFDPGMNGPMVTWAIRNLRDNLPAMLRAAGGESIAKQVELTGFDQSVLGKIEAALGAATERAIQDSGMVEEGVAWLDEWKKKNPNVKIGI